MNDLKVVKNRRVLVIDDNRAIHDDFRKILSPDKTAELAMDASEAAMFGSLKHAKLPVQFQVDSAYQGQEGLLLVQKAKAESRPYAMAFVDVRMPPGMDGVETTQKIWAIDPEIQIVLCTAYSDASWDEMLEKIGDNDRMVILKKPFDGVEAFQLAHALTEKWWLSRQAKRKMDELEGMVAERTRELAGSLSLLNATLESTTDGIVAVNLAGKIISYNTKFAALWQFPAGMLARQDAAEMRAYTAERITDPELFRQRIKEQQATPEAEFFDVIELKDERVFERYVFPQRINGRCVGVVVNWRDITERKRAEAELNFKNIILSTQQEISLDGILVVDENIKVLSFNRRLVELWGIPAELTASQEDHPFLQFVASQTADPPSFLKRVQYLYEHRQETSREEIRLKDGRIFDRFSAAMVGVGDRYYGRVWYFRDITETKRAEEALRSSQYFLRSTLDALSAHIAILDEHGTIIQVNTTWIRFAAGNQFRGRAGGVGENYLKVCDAATGRFSEEAAAVAIGIRAVMSGQREEFQVEYPCHSPQEQRWFIVRGSRFGGDGPVRVVVAHENITARKLAEQTLRESNEKFRQLVDNITDVFWIRSPDLSVLHYVSPAFERIWGRTVASLQANPQSWVEFIFPEDRERVLAAFTALTGDAPSLEIEYRIVRPDGEIRWVRVRGYQIRNADKKLVRHTGIVTDITERKQTDRRLVQSEARYRSLIENAKDAIFTIAMDGTFTSLNPAVETIAGLSRADWLGKPFAPMVHPEDLPLAGEMFQRILKGGQAPVHELRGHPSLSRPAIMEMTLTAQKDESGKIIGVLGIGRDITERKKLEIQLFQSQKMETVGKLAGGIAHEFNSILTAIIGQSELMLEDLPAGSPLRENAGEISKAAARAATLTRQLLAYGRGQFLRPEALDLNQVIDGMKDVLGHLMGGEKVIVKIIPTAGLQMVKADTGQIEQVILNLAMNARDAMPNGGQLTLETANVSFDQDSVGGYPELKPGDYVMLALSDTGAGMSAAVKARAFEPFFTTKDVGQGTGLGLSTCYGIVKQSGGHISVYSELGRGTTFKIYLPQVELPPKIPVRGRNASGLPRGTETILLVEDDPALRDMAATLLRRLGYKVLAAANGVEALSLSHEPGTGRIDLLFTDVVMPHMSGKELADRVRVLYEHTRILFTSAYTEHAIVHQGALDRGVRLIQKPFTPSALAHKVREVLDASHGQNPDGAQSSAAPPNPTGETTPPGNKS